MTQQESIAGAAARPPADLAALPLDAARLDQFVDLQRRLLLWSTDPEGLADRLVQSVAVFLGVAGAAVAARDEDGAERVLATYGTGPGYAEHLAAHPGAAGVRVTGRALLFPFEAGAHTGALHLILAEGQALPDRELHLARTLAVLAGIALENAAQCQRFTRVARLRSDALAAMAHDLRAPLNALVGYANLLGEGAFGPLTDEQKDIAGILERQAIELVDLLGATLDIARLETGRMSLRVEEFALSELLATLGTGTFARPSRDGVLTWHIAQDLPPLRTDRVKVKEIVQNLVDNALKHNGSGPVEVDAGLSPDPGTARITVRDTGRGIGADVLPHLFEPFRAGEGHGTGFGLYIVRCFTEALGGRVAARSQPGSGTSVTVDLPLAAPDR